MKNVLYVILVLVLLGGLGYGGYYLMTRGQTDTQGDSKSAETNVSLEVKGSRNNPTDTPEDAATDVSLDVTDSSLYNGTILAGTTSPVLDFNESDYDQALKSDKLVVLYFYAEWCPICKKEITDALYPAFDELNGDGVVAFRVNFNDSNTDGNETALAREFGVAYQHTKVFLKDGERVGKWPDSWDTDRYLDEIANNV